MNIFVTKEKLSPLVKKITFSLLRSGNPEIIE